MEQRLEKIENELSLVRQAIEEIVKRFWANIPLTPEIPDEKKDKVFTKVKDCANTVEKKHLLQELTCSISKEEAQEHPLQLQREGKIYSSERHWHILH